MHTYCILLSEEEGGGGIIYQSGCENENPISISLSIFLIIKTRDPAEWQNVTKLISVSKRTHFLKSMPETQVFFTILLPLSIFRNLTAICMPKKNRNRILFSRPLHSSKIQYTETGDERKSLLLLRKRTASPVNRNEKKGSIVIIARNLWLHGSGQAIPQYLSVPIC